MRVHFLTDHVLGLDCNINLIVAASGLGQSLDAKLIESLWDATESIQIPDQFPLWINPSARPWIGSSVHSSSCSSMLRTGRRLPEGLPDLEMWRNNCEIPLPPNTQSSLFWRSRLGAFVFWRWRHPLSLPPLGLCTVISIDYYYGEIRIKLGESWSPCPLQKLSSIDLTSSPFYEAFLQALSFVNCTRKFTPDHRTDPVPWQWKSLRLCSGFFRAYGRSSFCLHGDFFNRWLDPLRFWIMGRKSAEIHPNARNES